MNDYRLLIAWVISGCSLLAVLLIYLYCRNLKRYYNRYLMKHIGEQDRLKRLLEQTCIEKNTIEKLFETYFSRATE